MLVSQAMWPKTVHIADGPLYLKRNALMTIQGFLMMGSVQLDFAVCFEWPDSSLFETQRFPATFVLLSLCTEQTAVVFPLAAGIY